jgi:acetylglutamate kinase
MMRVIKVGGRVQRDPALPRALAAAWRQAPGTLCVVHGGGDEISALQQRMGVETAYIDGRRVTTRADLDLVRMSLSGLANKRLVSQLTCVGVPAVGVSGEDGAMITGERIGAAYEYAGLPTAVDCRLPRALLDTGFMPVLSPLSRDREGGGALNVNGDDAACALGASMNADEILFVADVPGVLRRGLPCDALDSREALHMIESGEASAGMIAKLQAACSAIAAGVARVRIGGIAAIYDPAAGTLVHDLERARVPA